MLLNVFRERPAAIPGTRMLESTLGILGVRLPDPDNVARVWEIQGIFLPVSTRALGGVRIRLVDQKNFVTFCNQRDLEILLGIGTPGEACIWSGGRYYGPDEPEWCGFCCDEEDLQDDLFEREMFLRAQVPGGVLVAAPEFDIQRRVHLSKGSDVEDVFVLLHDMDPETWMFPDTRLETVERRWMRSERVRVRWERS